MAECPAGIELRLALGNMSCKSCSCRCIIRHLYRELRDLQNENSKLKMDVDNLDYDISDLEKKMKRL